MEPIFTIGLKIELSQETLAAINGLADAIRGARPAGSPAPKVQEAPAPVQKPEPAPEAPSVITDEDLRALIKETRTRTSPQAVRALFNEFGIKTSIECPDDRRPELVRRLNAL